MRNSKLAGLAALAGLTGCGSTYTSNLHSEISENPFSDKEYSLTRKEVILPSGNYVFARIADNASLDLADGISGNLRSSSEIFPFYALRTNEMVMQLSPENRTATFMPSNSEGLVRVFEFYPEITTIGTNRRFEQGSVRENGIIRTVGEPKFEVPAINFGVEGYKSVVFGLVDDPRTPSIVDSTLALIPNPVYRINEETGLVELRGQVFLEKQGSISYRVEEETRTQMETEVNDMLWTILEQQAIQPQEPSPGLSP